MPAKPKPNSVVHRMERMEEKVRMLTADYWQRKNAKDDRNFVLCFFGAIGGVVLMFCGILYIGNRFFT